MAMAYNVLWVSEVYRVKQSKLGEDTKCRSQMPACCWGAKTPKSLNSVYFFSSFFSISCNFIFNEGISFVAVSQTAPKSTPKYP